MAGWAPYLAFATAKPGVQWSAVLGKDGAVWASNNPQPNGFDAAAIARDYKAGQPVDNKGSRTFNGSAYMYLGWGEGFCRLKSGPSAVVVGHTAKAIVVCCGGTPQDAQLGAEAIAGALKGVGF